MPSAEQAMKATFQPGAVTPQRKIFPVAGSAVRWLPALFVLWLVASTAPGQEPAHPLKPPDRSSPHAALKTFLDSGDAVGAFWLGITPSPSRANSIDWSHSGMPWCDVWTGRSAAGGRQRQAGRRLYPYGTLSRISFRPLTKSQPRITWPRSPARMARAG
jgi:hypothetical protein